MESALQESTPPSSDLFTAWELDNLTAEQLADPVINQKARASLVALSKAKQEQKSSVYQDVREEDRLSPELRKELDESLATDKVVDETLTDNVVTTSVIDQTFGNEGRSEVIFKSTDDAANLVAKNLDGTLSDLKNGYKIEIPNGNKPIVVRIMNEGSGGRSNPYFRVSVDGKGSLTLDGKLSNDRGLTHIDMTNDYLKQITDMINKYQGK